MKSEVKQSEAKQPKPFPKLMATKNGTIVLFFRNSKGTCVSTKKRENKLGEYSELWDMDVFTDFDGSVTLSNE